MLLAVLRGRSHLLWAQRTSPSRAAPSQDVGYKYPLCSSSGALPTAAGGPAAWCPLSPAYPGCYPLPFWGPGTWGNCGDPEGGSCWGPEAKVPSAHTSFPRSVIDLGALVSLPVPGPWPGPPESACATPGLKGPRGPGSSLRSHWVQLGHGAGPRGGGPESRRLLPVQAKRGTLSGNQRCLCHKTVIKGPLIKATQGPGSAKVFVAI